MSELVRITRVLTFAEFVAINEEAVAKGFYRNDRRVLLPGWAWPQPVYFDPLGELAAVAGKTHYRGEAMFTQPPADPDKRGFLSPHYWRDWAGKRAPICVVCPNGEQWEIDRWSSNGTGWTVTGDLPNITCSPSIVVDGYHGYLRAGAFTADLEGRGPRGAVQA